MRKKIKNNPGSCREGFSPVIGREPKVLILGTFPGGESLKKNQYYGNSRNTFWYILCKLLNIAGDTGYEEKKEALVKNGIALWDVIKACRRIGSLDSSIQENTIEINDLNYLLSQYPGIERIYFNGGIAEKYYKKRVLPALTNRSWNIKYHRLPSTSPAMARLTKEQKLKEWAVIKIAIKEVR